MVSKKGMYRLITVLISLATLMLITVIAKNSVGFNATTVALFYLLVVLATSAFADIACGIVTAVASGLLVNYYFLPPFRTFYIETPEDWVSFVAYTVTAVVVSHFVATVRKRAVEADRLQAQLSQFFRFTEALMAVRKEDITLDILAKELRQSYGLSYCTVYLFGKTCRSPVSSGIRPSQLSQDMRMPSNLPNTFLDVVAEEGSDVQCLALKDQGVTVGALVISRIALSQKIAEAISSTVSLVSRQSTSA